MGNLAWLAHPDNPAKASGTTITVTTANASYPASNLKALPITSTWRSTAVASAQDIEIDFGAAQSVDILALVHHNLTSGAEIRINAGTSTAYTEFSSVLMTWREFLAFKYLSTASSYRYWRIRITDTANSDGYIEVGYLLVGPSIAPAFNFRQGWTTSSKFVNLEGNSVYNVPLVDEIYRHQTLHLDFGPLTASEMSTLRTLYTTVLMDTNPLILLPDRNGTDAYFVRIIMPFEEKLESAQIYTGLDFEEDGHGNRR